MSDNQFTLLRQQVAQLQAKILRIERDMSARHSDPLRQHRIGEQSINEYHLAAGGEASVKSILGADGNGLLEWLTESDYMLVDGSRPFTGDVTIGDGTADTDFALNFDGETNDGAITWMEDEDYFLADDYRLDNTQWDDLMFPVQALRRQAAAPPTWTSYKGSEVLAFAAGAINRIYFAAQMPHTWKEGTSIYPHVHFTCPSDEANKGVRWVMTYAWANVDGDFPSSSQLAVTADINNDTDRHIKTSLGEISGSGKTFSSMLLCSLHRNTAHADDDYTDNAYLLEIDIHYEKWRMGTDNELTD